MAIDEINKLVVFAFRGTASRESWHHYFRKKCEVHDGFWDQWNPTREELIKKVQEAYDSFPDFRLIVTGHSLGGAIAIFAAADIRKLDEPWYSANTALLAARALGAIIPHDSSQNNQRYPTVSLLRTIPFLICRSWTLSTGTHSLSIGLVGMPMLPSGRISCF